MMGIDQEHDRVSCDRFAPFVDIADEIAGKPNPKTLRVPCIPGFVGHFLARRLKPGNVRHISPIDFATLKKFPSLKYRLGVSNFDDRLNETKKSSLFV